ncbi:MAG: hypothetical protein FD161_832 [Limisphaerales bacterium]|nr:MAG: hypothetical protein FD161_832 [Limisphaerales bacterium]KAG0509991.1 MAG: hypothetical protein E1N63_832 [Limisphaerales bacterium]TXT53119.1 MAG: hypothetical protein FD140_227 [Limisphaerales bacterium]
MHTNQQPPDYARYLGIDYSGARTPISSLRGLRMYLALGSDEPCEVKPPPGLKRYWTRRGVAEYLITVLRESPRTIVGIDHGFSFPLAYFNEHKIRGGWDALLGYFLAHWPTHEDSVWVDHVRYGLGGQMRQRTGDSKWRRLCELRVKGAKSVFHFDCQGSVAKSTHAGLPWLRRLRSSKGVNSHFWPLDGWEPPPGGHTVAEVYPSLWRGRYPVQDSRTADQQDAYTVAKWLQEADLSGKLQKAFAPNVSMKERVLGRVEGWILGVG